MPDFTKIDADRLERAGSSGSDAQPESPDQDAVERFRQSLLRKDAGRENDGRNANEPLEPDCDAHNPPFPPPTMELFSQRMTSMPVSSLPPEVSLPADTLAEKLVEQILVGRGSAGEHEVRLRLGPDVLPGTEIRIQRGPDGMIHVSLISDNAASFQTLVAAQDSLRQRLEHSGDQVRVTVSSETGREESDSQQRSRGYIPQTDETS